jgi:UDP-GlcNAc:undecaprenyl-phosphate GlcNAc-1-phosphate transferase
LSVELRALAALCVAAAAVSALTPVALKVAARLGFYDHPSGYKSHPAPTFYLGGASLIAGVALATLAFAGDLSFSVPIIACGLALCALGTIDDRITVAPRYRILGELAAAAALWMSGLGWSFLASGFEELLLTSLWVVGVTNAFNLMDNMDGAAGTVGGVCAAGVGALALIEGNAALAALTFAVAGACLAFLRYNIQRGAPARIFLGDGGSMPLGCVLAAATMQLPADIPTGWPVLLGAGLLLGLPVLDTLLVVVSRYRRRVALVTGGRDHLTHRLHMRLGSAGRVALTLALAQAAVSTLAVAALQYGRTATLVTALVCLAAGVAVIAILDSPAWTGAPVSWPGTLDAIRARLASQEKRRRRGWTSEGRKSSKSRSTPWSRGATSNSSVPSTEPEPAPGTRPASQT